MRYKIIALIITLSIIVGTLYAIYDIHKDIYPSIKAKVVITITHNDGSITRIIDNNDPITMWWINLLFNTFFGVNADVKDIDGNVGAYTVSFENISGRPYIGIKPVKIYLGIGKTQASYTDYKLSSPLFAIDINNAVFINNTAEQQFTLLYNTTFTSPTNFTLTEIGLTITYYYLQYVGTTPEVVAHEILVVHDSLLPIPISPGDKVNIQYYFILVYNKNNGFLSNFYYMIIQYALAGTYYDVYFSNLDRYITTFEPVRIEYGTVIPANVSEFFYSSSPQTLNGLPLLYQYTTNYNNTNGVAKLNLEIIGAPYQPLPIPEINCTFFNIAYFTSTTSPLTEKLAFVLTLDKTITTNVGGTAYITVKITIELYYR